MANHRGKPPTAPMPQEILPRPAAPPAAARNVVTSPWADAAHLPLPLDSPWEILVSSKAGNRIVLAGGPIRQPESWWVFRKDPGSDAATNTFTGSYPEWAVPPGRLAAFPQFARQIVSGEIQLPLVYKPNLSSIGHGIFFVTGEGRAGPTVTMAHVLANEDDPGVYLVTAAIHNDYLGHLAAAFPQCQLERRPKENIVHLHLPAGPEGADILTRLWRSVASVLNSSRFYDSGMMETMLPFFKPGGRSYETRHCLIANPSGGPVVRDPLREPPFARIGSSGYFANVMGRTTPPELKGEHLYDPLVQAYLSEERRAAFAGYVNDLLCGEVQYALRRLRAAAVPIQHMFRALIDLAYLPPEEAGGFPVPVLTEASFSF